MTCELLGFTNMEYFPPLIMPSMTPEEEAAYEAEYPEDELVAAKKKTLTVKQKSGFPWWLLLLAGGAYYYSQR